MQELYNFNAVTNSEIKFRWIRLGLKCKWANAIPLAIQMVSEQGRMKFLRPIYRYFIHIALLKHYGLYEMVLHILSILETI